MLSLLKYDLYHLLCQLISVHAVNLAILTKANYELPNILTIVI